jgi:Skp family chaperone for outer membrane proteins
MTPEEIQKKEEKLAAMEADIQKKCEEIDKAEINLAEKQKKVEQLLAISESNEVFGKFYTLINEVYTLWIAKKGSHEGLWSAAEKIMEARRELESSGTPNP